MYNSSSVRHISSMIVWLTHSDNVKKQTVKLAGCEMRRVKGNAAELHEQPRRNCSKD